MAADQIWDDDSRDELREQLTEIIHGELRLARRDHQAIADYCREMCVDSECPEDEVGTFLEFVVEETKRTAFDLEIEQSSWPDETDCDRLDRVEIALRERGILLWQVSPCCDTCTSSELPDRLEVINSRDPGFADRIRGYAFFIDQNMPAMLAESSHISVYMAYGWYSPEDEDEEGFSASDYETKSLGIAHEVCECLDSEGLEVDWNGSFDRKIGISLNWQRRELLK